jgi:putative ATPase
VYTFFIMDLFSSQQDNQSQPLAYRMRPRTLIEYIGQDHIVGEGRLLRRAIQADQLSSVIFYGPPGTGKTTLARVIANTTKSHFATLNAVLTGVKQLREEIDAAKRRLDYYNKRTILFIDEVHRWNKSQQDALLPWVENGTVILIGATTENPYFEVNAALVSRSRVFQLLTLSEADLKKIAEATLSDSERGYGKFDITFESGALEHLVNIANGDARSLLNALELAVETTPKQFPPPEGEQIFISKTSAEESIQRKVVLYDKEGDYHFDVISAYIKSIRGSDPDAALYWLARMVDAGEDPKYIFRRMMISASEDIGLADPTALVQVEAAVSAFERVGMPEGRFHMAQATLYLATAPKSNSTMGFFSALKQIKDDPHREVPNHLKDASRDSEGFGHGKGYQYPHAFADHWVAQQYLPDGLQGNSFYNPSDQGYELSIRKTVQQHREAQMEAGRSQSVPEVLTFSPPDTQKDQWIQRLITQRGDQLQDVRQRIFSALEPRRHSTILVIEQGTGLLVWEACRQTPEGGVTAVVTDKTQMKNLHSYARELPELQRPELTPELPDGKFDLACGYNIFTRLSDQQRNKLSASVSANLHPKGKFVCCETIVSECQRLSSLCFDEKDTALLERIEGRIYAEMGNAMVNLSVEKIESILSDNGFTSVETESCTVDERRLLLSTDISRWIESSYLPLSEDQATADRLKAIGTSLASKYHNTVVNWKIARYLFSAK